MAPLQDLSPTDASSGPRTFAPCAPIALGDEEWSRGAFGSVFVVDGPSGKMAVKRVSESVEYANRELETCTRLASDDHPHIVDLIGYWTEDTSPTTRVLYLVMGFMPDTLGGVLARLVANEMRMREWRMIALMRQLAGALEHLESIGLMHRDLKPDNILVHLPSNQLRLADFGSAKFVSPNQPNATYICTRFYRAPELILNRTLYSTSIDVWAFGCILGEFAKGGPLFPGETQSDVLSRIMRTRGMVTMGDIARMPTHNTADTLNTEGIGVGLDLAPRPWSRVFTRRIRNKRLITSYGQRYETALDGCLQWNPSRRMTASALRRCALFTNARGGGCGGGRTTPNENDVNMTPM